MAWIRIDDHFDEHPKHAQVGPLGWALWMAGLAYSNRNLTDGFIPWAIAQHLVCWDYLEPPDEEGHQKRITIAVTSGMVGDDVQADRIIELLVAAGLWESCDGGFYIHDYDDYQLTKAQIEEIRETKRRAGQAGAKASAKARARAKGQRVQRQNGSPNPNPNPNPRPTPNPDPTPTTALTDADFARIQAHYEQTYGVALTPTQANALAELAEESSLDDVVTAITEAARCGKSHPGYIAVIVRRWAVEGRQPMKGAKHGKGRRNSDEAELEQYCIDNWKLLGFASQADAERAAVGGD